MSKTHNREHTLTASGEYFLKLLRNAAVTDWAPRQDGLNQIKMILFHEIEIELWVPGRQGRLRPDFVHSIESLMRNLPDVDYNARKKNLQYDGNEYLSEIHFPECPNIARLRYEATTANYGWSSFFEHGHGDTWSFLHTDLRR